MDIFSFLSGLGQFGSGMRGGSEKPFDAAGQQYKDWTNKAATLNSPYYNAGTGAIPDYQNWLTGQKDPAQFINNLMGNYNESDYAHNLQNDAMNAGTNFGSASGLTGSSALAQQMQQNAGKISSQDMNQWLQNALGINTQYGQGQKNLVDMGQNATNSLTNLYSNTGNNMANAAYGSAAGKRQDNNDFWGGIGNMIGSFF